MSGDDWQTAEEHLAWAKNRALEYVEMGDHKAALAAASMTSDLAKHSAWRASLREMGRQSIEAAMDGAEGVRRWIEGIKVP